MSNITGHMHHAARSLVHEMANGPSVKEIMDATRYRDKAWKSVDINLTKSMDLYTTTKEAAEKCVQVMQDAMRDVGLSPDAYMYVDPSAGRGSFLEVLPVDTVAMDILPQHPSVKRQEFLTWVPTDDKRYAVVGAPPLGVYSDVSVAFVNHALEFAEIVGMIVRAHIGERQIAKGEKARVIRLDEGAIVDMTGGSVKYD